MRARLNVSAVHRLLIDQAVQAFEDGDAVGLLMSCGGNRDDQLALVADNILPLKKRGIYEACLLFAITDARTNFHYLPSRVIQTLFSHVDKDKMRAAGDPVPDRSTFRVFRGIAGRKARRPRGFSWTLSLDVACWFATRLNLPDPCVIVTEIKNNDVLAYTNEWDEQEVICSPTKCQKMDLTPAEIKRGFRRFLQATQQSFGDKTPALPSKINEPGSATAATPC